MCVHSFRVSCVFTVQCKGQVCNTVRAASLCSNSPIYTRIIIHIPICALAASITKGCTVCSASKSQRTTHTHVHDTKQHQCVEANKTVVRVPRAHRARKCTFNVFTSSARQMRRNGGGACVPLDVGQNAFAPKFANKSCHSRNVLGCSVR